ncbi:MAG: histidine kinase [Acidimicrobiales bacterium]
MREALWLTLVGVIFLITAVAWFAFRGGRHLGTPMQRATYEALHTASLAAPALRAGLTQESAGRAVPYLRTLLDVPGVALGDPGGILASENLDPQHCALLDGPLQAAMVSGRPQTLTADQLACGDSVGCPLQAGVVVPVQVAGTVVGALAAVGSGASAGQLRLAGEVAQFVSTHLELAELDRSRRRADQAELRFLRAQISPHFIYNALTAIESFVRTDPERARELLIGFADFTRYSFRSHGQFVTMAEELRLVDTYLDLERARFGDRLSVTLRVAPEVLSVVLPSLVLQPLVENAVRHGLEPAERPGKLSIAISDADNEALVTIEDDGVGADPAYLGRVLSGNTKGGGIGLHNVDERLRAVFGEENGLTIETGVGAGTKVLLHIPKFHSGVQV